MSGLLQPITDRTFDQIIAGSPVPVLVEFWKPGCSHCHALGLELERLQQELGARIHILTMNVEDNYQIPAELEVSSLPALALYRNGEFVQFVGGLGKKEEILKVIGF